MQRSSQRDKVDNKRKIRQGKMQDSRVTNDRGKRVKLQETRRVVRKESGKMKGEGDRRSGSKKGTEKS